MKKIAVLMNTNELGGAERSLVLQLMDKPGCEFTFFIPDLNSSGSLEKFLNNSGFHNIQFYEYPSTLYSLTRKKLRFSPGIILEIIKVLLGQTDLKVLSAFDIVYLNGNKAAFYFFIIDWLIRFPGKVVWHLRDYYHESRKMNLLWKLVFRSKLNLCIVCNSHSVKKSLTNSPWRNIPVEVVYNPSGQVLKYLERKRDKISVIGFVAMVTPWKGLHEIILWSRLCEEELKSLGIEQIKIYGSNIYKTQGDHSLYLEQLLKLNSRFGSDLLVFEGHKEPEAIYREIDCLIHYSLQAEPFGRVIIEAMDAGIPIISTCLGGAGELIVNQKTGIKVFPYDRYGLTAAIHHLIHNKLKTAMIVSGGKKKSKEIQHDIPLKMNSILELGEAS